MPRKKSDTRSVDTAVDSSSQARAWTGQERRQEPRDGIAGEGGARLRRKPDESLAQEIHEILISDPELDATDVEVVVEGGAVTLSGEVEHPDAKLLAEELTESVAGVRLVHNRLVVRR